VKGYSLPEVAPALRAAAERGAVIVPFLNGIDVAERLTSLGVPAPELAGGLARVSVARTAPGAVERFSALDNALVGLLRGTRREHATTLAQLAEALGRASITAAVSGDIAHELWRKFAFIVPMGVACGLTRTTLGPVQSSAEGRMLLARSVAEIVAVSVATGGSLRGEDEAATLADLMQVGAHVKPSFLLDLERGGPTEVDMLAGAVVRLGRASATPTPLHEIAAAAFTVAVRPTTG
jgi:2-dehydropantoate 2-reductase